MRLASRKLFVRTLGVVFGLSAAAVLLYLCAALLGGFLVAARNPNLTGADLEILVYDNGIHTGLILPRQHTNASYLPQTALSADFPGAIEEYPWVMVSWGDREFFLNTPTWSDVGIRTALNALFASGKTLLHIDRLSRLPPRSSMRSIKAGQVQLETIEKWISTQFSRYSTPIPGYGIDDRFYESSRSDYSALYNCNNWTGEGLALAGIKTGLWTPLPFGIMWW